SADINLVNTSVLPGGKNLRKLLAVIGALAVIVSSTMYVYVSNSNEAKSASKKELSDSIVKIQEEVNREAHRYENLLATVGAFFNASESVSAAEFEQFVKGLGIETSYPGVKGIAYAQ